MPAEQANRLLDLMNYSPSSRELRSFETHRLPWKGFSGCDDKAKVKMQNEKMNRGERLARESKSGNITAVR